MRDTPDSNSRIQRYVWLLRQIRRKVSSFEEFNEAWEKSQDVNSAKSVLSRRTFYNYLKDLEENYGIAIRYDKAYKCYTYELLEDMVLNPCDKAIRNAIIDVVEDDIKEMEKKLESQGRLMMDWNGEKNPKYRKVIEAMDQGHVLLFRYQNADGFEGIVHRVKPLAVKYYNHFWYLWGEDVTRPEDNLPRTDIYIHPGKKFFALNGRLKEFLYCDEKFNFSNSNDILDEFKGYYGVMTGDREKGTMLPEKVMLKVYTDRNKHSYYLENPIHRSQKEIERCFIDNDTRHPDSYIKFEYHIAPTFDFIQKLLSDREDIEVLEPEHLRDEMRQIIGLMGERYH